MKGKQQNFYYKKMTRAMAGALSLMMLLGALPLQALAATYEVGDSSEMVNKWAEASGNSDASNTFNMTADINMENKILEVKDGKTYNINGNGNTLSNAVIHESSNVSKESQQADVSIKAQVESTGDNVALSVRGDVNVIVTGDVEGSGKNQVLYAYDGAEVAVKGDVETTGTGIAIVAKDDAEVLVTGDVASKASTTILALDASVQVQQDVILEGDDNDAAISARNDAKVTVEGDLISGNSAMNVTSSTVTVKGDIISDGQSVIQGSKVTVNGDFLVQENKGKVTETGGLYVTKGSEVYMADGTMLESDQIHVAGNSELNAAMVDTAQVTVGIIAKDENDASEFYGYANGNGSNITNLDSAGKSYTQIVGHVDSIVARENANVKVTGSAGKVAKADKAKVTIYNPNKNDLQTYLPTPTGENYPVGNTTAYDIINMCNGYTVGSTLYNQHSEMLDLLADVSVDISDNLNMGNAALAALFDHETINKSSYLSGDSSANYTYNYSYYNEESKENFRNASNLNTYLIAMYKNNLLQSMADIDSGDRGGTSVDENELLLKIFAVEKNIEDAASGLILSEEERIFLKGLSGSDGVINSTEMLSFLKKFGYYKDGGVVLAAQRLTRMYENIGPFLQEVEAAGKLVQAGITLVDFIKYTYSDYTNQIAVLDAILGTQPLSAEMFAATVELRNTLDNKMLGHLEKTADIVKNGSVSTIKSVYGPLVAGQAILDLTGLITGGTKDAQDLQNGAALTILAPQLLTFFENSVKEVQNGDTSKDAVRMVYMSYNMVCSTLEEMCSIMTNIGDKNQKNEYKNILRKLQTMEIGQVIDLG